MVTTNWSNAKLSLPSFSAATLGLPKLLNEEDIHTEYPHDTDDEYITEDGFQPTLPGEYTRLSSALALLRMSRILARILDKVYPSVADYELSLEQLRSFEVELDTWYQDLPVHLRLTFSQDKPSADMTSSRSPLLALAYHHVRTLIYRPVVGSSLGDKAAPGLLSITDSSKRIIQIVQLLEERNMSFSFCLNKHDLLALCGLTLLYQVIELRQDSKLTRDIERLVNVAIKRLNDAKAPGCADLVRIAENLIRVDDEAWHWHCHCRRPVLEEEESMPGALPRAPSKDPGNSLEKFRQQDSDNGNQGYFPSHALPDLDYLSLNNHSSCNTASSASPCASAQMMGAGDGAESKTGAVSPAEWEVLLGSMDGGLNNVYDAIYGGASLVHDAPDPPPQPADAGWSPDSWHLHRGGNGMEGDAHGRASMSLATAAPQGEEAVPSGFGLGVGSADFGKDQMQQQRRQQQQQLGAFGFDLEGVVL
ncbi:hypothetical protein E4U41_002990 [Claviceps citrina]|nr:hypothetical protein E4U41_002990 [Claviceps citrina]